MTEVTQGMFQELMNDSLRLMEMVLIFQPIMHHGIWLLFANTLGALQGEQACYSCSEVVQTLSVVKQ